MVLWVLWFYVRETESSTGRVSGFKASKKPGPRLKVSSNRLGESGIELGTLGYKASDLSTVF